MSMTMPQMIGFARNSARTATETDDYITRIAAISAYHQNIIDTLVDENCVQHIAATLAEYYAAISRIYTDNIPLSSPTESSGL